MHERSLQEKPLVSIVLPVYNGEKYLRESLDSILAQTMEDWELIAVDDCSKDATPQILADYAASDSRIRVMRNAENQRLPRSLNIGFAEARGEFLTWTSDDNAYAPEALHETLIRGRCSSRTASGRASSIGARFLRRSAATIPRCFSWRITITGCAS